MPIQIGIGFYDFKKEKPIAGPWVLVYYEAGQEDTKDFIKWQRTVTTSLDIPKR